MASQPQPHRSLLSWKHVSSWSLACRVRAFCRLLLQSVRSPTLRLRKTLHTPPQAPAAAVAPPPTSPSSSPISSLSNCLRRISDASAPAPRLSTSSYERLSVDSSNGCADLPRIVRLGGASTDPPRLSGSSFADSASVANSSRFMGSPAVLSCKLKGTCVRILTAAHHNSPHIGELFAGNQFLMHVTAAPVFGVRGNADVRPSAGLVDGVLRCRDSELRDRIVFFQ